jgi:hypothetical protein
VGFALVVSILALAAPAGAVSSVCPSFAGSCSFGQDLGNGTVPNPTDPTLESNVTQAAFLAMLVDPGTEDFAGFGIGKHDSLTLSFEGSFLGSATLTDTVASGGSIRDFLDANRGFPIDEGGLFWKNETTSDASNELFVVTFDTAVSAFGFYATAWSTESTPTMDATQLALYLWGDTDRTSLLAHLAIPHDHEDRPGGIFYFGVIADVPFAAVSLRNDSTTDPGDRIGFDDFTVATSIVPEPSTVLLFAAGLGGLAAIGKQRRAQG